MEDVEMMWSSENLSLEPLQPLPFSLLDDQEESINLDKLSRSEIAGKLLDHLDQIAERQETEPFDWFTNEKPIDLPFFENFSSSIPAVTVAAATVQHTNVKASLASSRYPYLDSPEYETPCTPTSQRAVYEGSTDVSATTQPQVTCVPSLFNADFFSANVNDLPASVNAVVSPVAIPPSPQFVNCNPKGEVLTPPDSPKDEEIEILELLQKLINGERSENVVPSSVSITDSSNVAADTGALVTDNTPNFDELSDDTASSSPYVGSECSSDNDADYVPASRASRRASAGVQMVGARRRASKPYSRHSAEERKLRKKEQNKNAATRYRMKKKQEVEECKNEEQRLADRNRELRNKLDDISREIKCLKSLMRDVYRKKGLIK